MPDLTVLIPIGLAHKDISQRAVESVRAQSISTNCLTWTDHDKRGPGYARNRLLALARTPYVTFLDADDWLEPQFAVLALARAQSNRYVYTDWIDHHKGTDDLIHAPAIDFNGVMTSVPDRKPWCGGTWHIITTVIPTEIARKVGGFDESLSGMEDTDFYLKLVTRQHCGIHLPEALVHYSGVGERSQQFHYSQERARIQTLISERYAGQMGCCGDDTLPGMIVPKGEHLATDIRARFAAGGNRKYVGRATRRIYDRVGNNEVYWVDPRDAMADPANWRPVDDPAPAAPVHVPAPAQTPVHTAQEVARVLMSSARPIGPQHIAPVQAPPAPPVARVPPPVNAKPNIARVLALGRKALVKASVFVTPDKDYPSYRDFFRLAKLSGYEVLSQVDPLEFEARIADPSAVWIFATPEPLPDLSRVKGRVIAWQLEYGGAYAHNYDGFQGEIWSSDPGHAARTGAKFVLMGSHPELATYETISGGSTETYDLTMLAYMVDRRQKIREQLNGLRWPVDYPGHDSETRHQILSNTRIMLHVHQHAQTRAIAPQRFALAAAYKMELVSERLDNDAGIPGIFAPYNRLAATVEKVMATKADPDALHQYLCYEHLFLGEVERALRE